MATIAKQSPAGIVRGAIYPSDEFCRRMGWGRRAFVEARRRGLKVRKASFRIYVSGDDAVDWLANQPIVAVPKVAHA